MTPPRCAFWDVDTQVDFMRPDGKLYVGGAETILANLAALTDFAHANGIRIVASSDCHTATDEELSAEPDFVDTYPPHCLAGTPGQARVPETTLRDALVVEPDDATDEVLRRLEGHSGDVLFHNVRLLHGSPPNVSDKLRRVVYYTFHTVRVEWQHGPHTHEYIAAKQKVLRACIGERRGMPYAAAETGFEYRPPAAHDKGTLAAGESLATFRYPAHEYQIG